MDIFGQMSDIDLQKWQKRQMERCLLENVINMVIETYDVLQRNSADIAQFNEHSQNLEESAILMAISEHGLHQSDHCPLPRTMDEQCQQHSEALDGFSGNSSTGANIENHNSTNNGDNFNVLEAAVSVAIQKQGLGLLGSHR